jgi:hypothetical protein
VAKGKDWQRMRAVTDTPMHLCQYGYCKYDWCPNSPEWQRRQERRKSKER